jgi:type I restriction enzyme S subunit
MTELPEGWDTHSVGELAISPSSISYGVLKPGPETVDGIPMLRVKDLKNGHIDTAKIYRISPELDSEYKRTKLKGGEVLLSIQGSVGRVAIVPSSLVGANVSRTLAVIPPINSEFAKWLWMMLQTPQIQDAMRLVIGGTTRDSLNLRDLRPLRLPVAPSNEQRRIVAKFEKLLNRVDAAQARLGTIPRILKRFRQSVLETACSGRLTPDWRAENPNVDTTSALLERIGKRRRTSLRFADAEADLDPNDLPESWLAVKIEELTHIQNGRAFPSKQYGHDGVRLLRPGNLHINGQVEWNDKNTACLPKQWSEDYPEFLLGAGELLMNLTAQSLKDEFLGRVCIKTDGVPALLNQRIARFLNHGTDDLRPYLFIYFKSPQFRSYVNTLDTGSLIRHMHSKQVLSHVAPLPPLAEQKEIVRRVEALFKTADALEARYRKAKAHVDKLTQSVLAKAFRGELVPQDPNDEPAAVLLERIKRMRKIQIDSSTKRPRR